VVAVKKSHATISVGLAAQEGRPGGVVTIGCGLDPVPLEDLPHGGRGDLDTEGGEGFAVDAPVAPPAILLRQSQHQGHDRPAGGRPAGAFGSGDARVTSADQVPMPTQDRVRGDDQLQLGPRQPVQQRGQEPPALTRQPRPVDLTLQHGELMAQHQNLDVLVDVAHWQQPDQTEHTGQG
jgi:hypothetical protein